MNPTPYHKPWLSTEAQLDQLIQRGMIVTDRAKALDYLDHIGYYRLSGYWHDFRLRPAFCPLDEQTGGKPKKVRIERLVLDEFKPGTRFQDAVALYVFDKRLRLLVLDGLERIEIALRVELSHRLGRADPFAYLRPELFHSSFSHKLEPATGVTRHHDWLSKHANLIGRSREEFIRHNKTKYGLPLAIWVACEVWDFGALSTLYAGLKEEDQDEISSRHGVANGRIFATWLRSLNYLRNVCAHHSRLWNRNIVDQPRLPPDGEVTALDAFQDDAHGRARPFLLFCICQHLLETINPRSSWGQRLKHLLEHEFPKLDHVGLTLQGMGVDANWLARTWSTGSEKEKPPSS